MRVLQLSNKPPYPPNDGSSIAMYNMSRGFIDNGVELTLLTINTKKHFKPDSEVDPEFKKQSSYTSVFRDTDVTAAGALLNLFSQQSYIASRFYFTEFEEKLISTLKKKEFDVIQLESIFMGEYIPAIRKHSKAKIAIRTHNIEHKIWERLVENEKSAFRKLYLRIQNGRLKKFERHVLESADAVVPITPVDEIFFREWGIRKPFCSSPTGLLFEKYKIDRSAELPRSVFHFGSMDWMPNEEAVLWFTENVWDKVAARVPEAIFYIAGSGISEKVRSIRKERIEVIGRTETPDYVYHRYQVMIIPLLSGSGMRIKMIEGMGYGKPIVSTSIGAEGIAVQNGRDCFLADTPEEFANKVTELLTNQEKRDYLARQARTFAEGYFDNKKLVAQLIAFYESLIH